MYTKRIFVGVVLTGIFLQGAVGAVKLWAARKSTHGGLLGTVADAANVAL